MKPGQQQDAFHVAQRKAADYGMFTAFAGHDLAMIGESLYGYVVKARWSSD